MFFSSLFTYAPMQAPRTSRARTSSSKCYGATSSYCSLAKYCENFEQLLEDNEGQLCSFVLNLKVFTQTFSFINVQLFNSLLLRRECCSFSNGEYVKTELAELEQWCLDATEEFAGSAWDELKHIRQAVGFLVLSIQQLYRISTLYWDDKYGNCEYESYDDNAVSSSFLLDDDSSIPFSMDDISKSMQQIEVAEIDLPPLIRGHSDFTFLLQYSE
ncbi:hypothetical protein F3Y22_tig00111769pilonHSYRG00497 [Hibiscus syriacus]|uniref:Dilute domain-containing protein n=1 Tax=Hibiscus syriacus TaxID=106335 RepID=A0A6A2XFJ1_HIBSY|nr:hypothetical protein F3Y22_tig00111769pilonHSYRG00497 [Hibiscus syriacus]